MEWVEHSLAVLVSRVTQTRQKLERARRALVQRMKSIACATADFQETGLIAQHNLSRYRKYCRSVRLQVCVRSGIKVFM